MTEQLEFGIKDLLNWGKKAIGLAKRTIIHIPDNIKRLIKTVIQKRNVAIQKYYQLRRMNKRYASIYYRKLQGLEREYQYLIKGNSRSEELGWVPVALAIGGVAIAGAVVGWIARGMFGTASTRLNKLISEYDKLIAEADRIMSRTASNDPQYISWRSKVSKTRNTALTTVATASQSLSEQIMDILKFGILVYIGWKAFEHFSKRGK